MNLAADLFRRMHEAPERQALAFEGQRWTYRALGLAISGRVALLAAHGVGAGDRVALILKNRPESVIALYACWAIGAVPVLVSPLYGPDDLFGAIEKTAPSLAIVGDALSDARAVLDRHGIATLLQSAFDAAGDADRIVEPVDLADDQE